jgi:phosphoesterase RecJ-like protein
VNTHATPTKFTLVDPRNEIQVHDPAKPLPKVDAVFVLDTNELKMLGRLEAAVRALDVPVIFVDHHVPHSDMDVDEHLIDEQFGSTGELVYSFLRHLRADVDAEMAMGIYVAIVTDTSSFRFKRTTGRSHMIAAELLQKGISPEQVYQHIYARDSFAKIRLFGHVLEGIKTSPDERIAWLTITKEMRQHYNATIEDTEAYVNQLTLIDGVDIGMLFREEDEGHVKVSIRGNGEIPVVGIAKKFGGGGHRHAAGVKRMETTLDEAIRLLYQEAQAVLQEYPKKKKS